jgi:hypothetical protein
VNWVEQKPHAYASNAKPLHILVSNDEYVAFVSLEANGFRAMVPKPNHKNHDYSLPDHKAGKPYHYTHDTLQEAKDWCIAELWKRRLDQ